MLSSLYRYAVGLVLTAALTMGQLRPAEVIILIGPPGSGKSVQAKLLSTSHKIPAISMASLLKLEAGNRTPLSKALASSVASGELVGDDAANQVMMARLLRPDAGRGFILDGYPTTEPQAKALDAFLIEHDFPQAIVVIIEAPDPVVRQRMKVRGRADDAPENIERRIREYREQATFTETRYGSASILRVDGTGSVQTVASAIARQIESARSGKGLMVRPRDGGLQQRPPAVP